VPSELDVVEAWRVPDPEHEHEFMLGAIERAHAGVGLVPHAQVQERAIDAPAHDRHVLHVTPVHAHEVHRPVA
jgi:hypothetical protein